MAVSRKNNTADSIKNLLGFSTNKKPPQRRSVKKNEEAHFLDNMRFRLFDLGVGMDMPLLIIVLSLVGLGLVVLFSASFAQAYYYLDNSYYYISRQIIFAVLGIAAMLVISTIDYHLFYRFNNLIFLITTFLLLIVLLMPAFSAAEGDAVRWISIGELSFQPSEVAKFSLVIMLASIIVKHGDKISRFAGGTFRCFTMTGVVAGLVVAQKHVSGAIIILAIAVVVMFVGGVKTRYFVILASLAVPVLIYLVFFSDSFAYALLRVQGWIDPFNPPEGVDTYQTVQSIYAIGSGQLFGVGLGQSTQKYMYLPQSRNDFIFPIAAEELGFVGAMIIILLFMALIWRGVMISINAKDKFGMLLGIGMTFTIGFQAILNICVVTNAIPNTGVSLPFFSYGGTSIMMLLGEMGVLLAVSRGSYMQKT